jgi:hypothetical protein
MGYTLIASPEGNDVPHRPNDDERTNENGKSTGTAGSAPAETSHPIAALAGVFANEPLWDEVMREVDAYRRRRDRKRRAASDAAPKA